MATVLVTGGTGLLGTALRARKPEWLYPPKQAFNIANPPTIVPRHDVIVHLAALTGLAICEERPEEAFIVNAMSVANVAVRARRIVYVSTDYVYASSNTPIDESGRLDPLSAYARSKLAGELAVRTLCPDHLILRGSFGPDNFPHDRAPNDTLTCKVGVTEFAFLVDSAVRALLEGVTGVFNVGDKPRSHLKYARSLGAYPESCRFEDLPTASITPRSLPLNTEAWRCTF